MFKYRENLLTVMEKHESKTFDNDREFVIEMARLGFMRSLENYFTQELKIDANKAALMDEIKDILDL